MFAFYLQESSFQWILIDEIEQVLSSINEIIINSNSLDTFYQFEDIICVRSSIYRKNICDILMSSTKTQYLLYRVLPYISRRIHSGYGPYRNLVQFQKKVNKPSHAFMGGKFIYSRNYELTTLSDFFRFRDDNIRKNINRTNFNKYYKYLFPNIILLGDVVDKLKSFPVYDEIVRILMELQEWLLNNENPNHYSLNQLTTIDISDESQTTKNDPHLHRFRQFTIPRVGSVYCDMHIKVNIQYRMHIYLDSINKLIYIPYIGNHLPT